MALVLALFAIAPARAAVSDQLVPMSQVNEDMRAATQARQANIAAVQRILATEQAQEMLRTAKIDLAKAQQAVTLLEDQELNQLAEKASQVEKDLAAGLTRGQTSLLILAGAVVIIIIVIAAVA